MGWQRRRTWIFIPLGVVGALALLVGLIHTPPARAALLTWGGDWLARRYGVAGRAERLDFNLANLDFRVHGVRLAAQTQPDDPFFEADEIHVDLDWSGLLRELQVAVIEIFEPRISLVRDERGSFNLPVTDKEEAETDTPAGLVAFPVGRLLVRDLDATFVDSADSIAIDDLTIDLHREGETLTGGINLARRGRIRWRGIETTIEAFESRLSFDGVALGLDRLKIETPEGRLALSGVVDSVMAEPRLQLSYEGRLNLQSVSEWIDGVSDLAGQVTFTGRVAGPLTDPTIAVSLESGDLTWGALRATTLDVSSTLTKRSAEILSAAMTVAGGHVEAAGRVAFGQQTGESRVTVSWRELPAGSLVAALRPSTPLRLDAVLNGQLRASWAALDPSRMTATLLTRSRATASRPGRLGLDGSLSLDWNGEAWRLGADQRLAGSARLVANASGRLPAAATDVMASRLTGSVQIEADDVARLLERLRAAGLDVPTQLAGVGGALDASLSLAGTLAAPRAAGTVAMAPFAYGGQRGQLDLAFSAGTSGVTVEGLEARVGPNRLAATGTVDFESQRLRGQVEATLSSLEGFTADLSPRWDAHGVAQIEATIAGRLAEPQVDANIQASNLRAAGQSLDSLSARVRLDGGVLIIDELTARQPEGSLEAQGRYDLEARTYRATAMGRHLHLRPIPGAEPDAGPIPIEAHLGLQFTGEGSLDDLGGHGTLRADQLAWDGSQLGPVDAAFDLTGGSLSATVTASELATRAEATLGLIDSSQLQVRGSVKGGDLSRLAAIAVQRAGPSVQGIVSLDFQLSGDTSTGGALSASVHLQALEASVGASTLTLQDPTRIEYSDAQVRIDGLVLGIGGTRLAADGQLSRQSSSNLTLTLNGDLSDLTPLVALATSAPAVRDVRANGPIQIQLAATGTLERPVVSGLVSVTGATITPSQQPPVSDLDLRASYRDGVLLLEELDARWHNGTLSASGRLPARLFESSLAGTFLQALPKGTGPANLSARISGLNPALVATSLKTDIGKDLDGALSLTLAVHADEPRLNALNGEIVIPELRLTLAGLPVGQREPTRVALSNGLLEVRNWRWLVVDDELTVDGAIDLAEGPRADLSIAGRFDLRLLGALADNLATAGHAVLLTNVRGSLTDPDITASAELEDAEIRVDEPRIVISDLNGAITFQHDQLTTTDLRGTINGGRLTLAGQAEFIKPTATGFLSIEGRNMALEIPEGLRSEANADLTLRMKDGELTLSGTATVLRGSYRERLSLTTGLLGAISEQTTVVAAGDAEPSLLDQMQLDMRVVTKDDLIVNNNVAKATVGLDLRVRGTPTQPALAGRVFLQPGGQVFLGTNTYELERGTIDFTDPTGIKPELNLTARAQVPGHDVTLNVTGAPQDLAVNLQSTPSAPESDLVSLLLTGRTLDQVATAPGTIATEQALGLASGEVLGTAGQSLGLDAVRLERGVSSGEVRFDPTLVASETDPAARLTIVRHLSNGVQLIVSQNLRETGLLTWIVSYLPFRNVEIRGVVDDENDRSYEFRHALSFGAPPGSEERTGAAESRVEQRVRAITFTGNPGFDEAELRGELEVKPGTRFDFFRWQDDQDRLARFYHERDYLEARIRARRDEGEGSGPVALTYEIQRGPRTTLTVEGYVLPSSVRREMTLEWAAAIFDGFLLDEIRSLARRALVAEGFLRPSINAEIRGGADQGRKEIVLRIDPGTKWPAPRLSLTGHAAFASKTLEDVLASRGLAQTAWVEPDRLESELQSFYRRRGYLTAEVAALEPEFSDGTATLPITITEGPLFRIDAIRVAGVAARSEATVKTELDLAPGTAYSDAAIAEARARVISGYREQGFNSVRVSVRSEVDAEAGTAAVTVNVDEGRQQIVRDVLITGAPRTDRSIITKALQLDEGEPVKLAEWSQARKRLYDTSVFRNVDLEAEPLEGVEPASPYEQPVRAHVQLQEWRPYRLRYGLQVKDEQAPLAEQRLRELGLGVVGDLTRQNLFGRAVTVGTATRLDADNRILRAYLTTASFFGLPISSHVFGARSRETGGAVKSLDLSTLTLEQRLRPRPDLTIAYSYDFEHNRTVRNALKPDDPFAFPVTFNVARLNASAVVERRDDAFNATRGWFHSSTFELGVETLGSDLRFTRYTVQQYYYGSLLRSMVFASGARLGLAAGFEQELIPSERFLAGGANTVRGYGQDSLGPRFLGEPDGGEAFIVLNQEVRFPMFKMFRGVGFLDAGNVFDTRQDFSLRGLKFGIGLGLRVGTPFGLFRMDYGRPLSQLDGEVKRSGRLYFSLGQVF